MPKHLLSAILLLFYACTVVMLHAAPTGEVSLTGKEVASSVQVSHLLHVAMFLPWGIIGTWYIYSAWHHRLRSSACWIAIGLFFAVCAEGGQLVIPYRSFSLTDLSFNIAGVIGGSLTMLLWQPFSALRERARERSEKANA